MHSRIRDPHVQRGRAQQRAGRFCRLARIERGGHFHDIPLIDVAVDVWLDGPSIDNGNGTDDDLISANVTLFLSRSTRFALDGDLLGTLAFDGSVTANLFGVP